MRYRVYKDGNILFFENLDNGVLYTGTDSVVRIISNNPNNTSFTVSGTSPSFTGNPLSIDSLYKKNYSKYTNLEWINFYTTATNYTPDDEFNGTMDDIPNGSTYVKTENNFSDADKNKLDTINALTDGNKGDVTVSSSGSVFTINSNSVGDSEIIDVSANKVTQNSSRRFVTDADKTYWNAKEDASNKTDVAVGNETSSVKFLSVKGVVDWVTSLFTPKSRTLTINGDTKDLSANRSWTISTSAVWGGITGTLSSQTDLQSALDSRVPYTGATGNVDIGEYELKAGQLTLDTSPTGTASVGTTRWNNALGSSETTLKGGTVILKNGVDLVARVVNKVTPSATLTKANYAAVKISGAQGQRLAVDYAKADTDLNSADTIGLVTETISANQEGFIITVGQLEGINTTGSLQGETWNDGDVLYLSPTTAGRLTNVKPTGATGHIVVIGYVEYSHAIHGKIYVKIMNGWELDELHNVSITGVTKGGSTLEYNTTNNIWINSPITWTVELIEVLTVDVYAPYNLSIDIVTNVLNSPTITIYDDGVLYVLGNTITSGSKITILANTASVINLTINKL